MTRYQGPYAGKCCGDPDCGYDARRRQATYPELRRYAPKPAPRWLTLGSRFLALLAAAGCAGIVVRVLMP